MVSRAYKVLFMRNIFSRRRGGWKKEDHSQDLAEITSLLQNLSPEERRKVKEFIASLARRGNSELRGRLPAEKGEAFAPLPEKPSERPELPYFSILEVGAEVQIGYFPLAGSICDDGLFIETKNPLDLGAIFGLRLTPPGSEESISAECKVIWTNQYGMVTKTSPRGMGVKFLSISPKDKERLIQYIRNHGGGP
ncbi:MAG: PilZ domain-containing protein [Deltaproteobacteria bacterium]|nr:PilZ domain-containing protein [Deltaproteobacteria bacterium]